MQGDTPNEEIINTNKTWKCIRDKAFQPINGIGWHPYYVAGPGERIDQNQSVKDWNKVGLDDSNWKNAYPY
jgi:alpha-L-rhamnosidase